MTITITADDNGDTTNPLLMLSPYGMKWDGRNVVHDLIGGEVAVALQTTRPRSGSISYLYDDRPLAFGAAAMHKRATGFMLTDSEYPDNIPMHYVVDGTVALDLDPDTLTAWILTVDFLAV